MVLWAKHTVIFNYSYMHLPKLSSWNIPNSFEHIICFKQSFCVNIKELYNVKAELVYNQNASANFLKFLILEFKVSEHLYKYITWYTYIGDHRFFKIVF